MPTPAPADKRSFPSARRVEQLPVSSEPRGTQGVIFPAAARPGIVGFSSMHVSGFFNGGCGDVHKAHLPSAGLQNLGAESVFRPRKRTSSYFLLKWDVWIPYLSHEN